MRIFLSAGEASGDAYGAAIVDALRAEGLTATYEGLGGSRMEKSGVDLLANSSHWGAISITHALPLVRKVFGSYWKAKRQLSSGEPGLFIPIDFGFVNIKLARHAKNRGWRVLYFVPPGSWRRDRQGKDLPAITDRIVTPFSWSADLLKAIGADVRWFGHPIKQLVGPAPDGPREVLAILPGSRKHEIGNNLPILAAAFRDWPHPIEFGLAPGTDVDALRAQWPRPNDTFTVGDATGTLSRGRAAVVCSGTATLEAALRKTPFVVVYEADDKMRREEKILTRLGLFRRPQYVGLPNILLQRGALPEMIDRVDPQALRKTIEALWPEDAPARKDQLAAFEELDTLLGPGDAITQTAAWIKAWVSTPA